jgi:TRAP-type C4-dicarboxylate transport system permease small subunit
MIQKIIIILILAFIVWGGWRITQKANYQTDHSNVDRSVRNINSFPSL